MVVVSEETGDISVGFRGRLLRKLSEGELRSELSRIFRIRSQDEPEAPAPQPEVIEEAEPSPPASEKAAG